MIWTIRMRNSSSSSSNIDLCTTHRAWSGLKLALQDPKVYIFSLFHITMTLGHGFINFFPTWAIIYWVVLVGGSGSFLRHLQFDRNNGFLNHHHTLTCIVSRPTLVFAWLYLIWNPRAPWFLAAILCLINARHAGRPTVYVKFVIWFLYLMIRCGWWAILAHNHLVVGRCRRLHHRAGHDVCWWSLCILVSAGIWLRWSRDCFGLG